MERPFFGRKAPAGAHPVAQNLESTCFMYLNHKEIQLPCIKNKEHFVLLEKKTCGNAPRSTELGKSLYVSNM